LAPAGAAELVTAAHPALPSATGSGQMSSDSLGSSDGYAISADGRFVTFTSNNPQLMAGQVDLNNSADVFLYDRIANALTLVSRAAVSPLRAGNNGSGSPSMSADGRYVAFQSFATDLVAGFALPPGMPTNVSHTFLYDRATGSVRLVNHAAGNDTLVSNDFSDMPLVSPDGKWVSFVSDATDLVPGYIPGGQSDPNSLFLYNTASGSIKLASYDVGNPLKGSNWDTTQPVWSNEPSVLAYSSNATNLVSGYSGGLGNIFVYDPATGKNELISRPAGSVGNVGAGASRTPVFSGNGRYVGYMSAATNLVPNFVDGNGALTADAYLYDRTTGSVMLVSRVEGTVNQGSAGGIRGLRINDDGRFVTFDGFATQLVAGMNDANGTNKGDVFLFDAQSNSMQLVSHSTTGVTVTGSRNSRHPVISSDGSLVLFASEATDLVAGMTPGNPTDPFTEDVYAFNRLTGVTQLVSHPPTEPTRGGKRTSNEPKISRDGGWVTFTTSAFDLVPQDLNSAPDVVMWDVQSGGLTLASPRQGAPSVSAGGNIGSSSDEQKVTPDGRYVVFTSTAPNIVHGQEDANGTQDIFLRDRHTGTTILVSRAAGSTARAGNAGSSMPALSDDGRFVVFVSQAADLVAGFEDNNTFPGGNYTGTDVYLFDRLSGTVSLVSHRHDSPTAGGNGASSTYRGYYSYPSISGDGQFVAYQSVADDLVAGFVNAISGGANVYLFDRVSGQNTLVNHVPGSDVIGSNGVNSAVRLSANGRYVIYRSHSSNLVAGQVGGLQYNIYSYDRLTGANILVSHAAGLPTTPGGGAWDTTSVSADGRYVLYTSAADNLVAGVTDENFDYDVFLYDRVFDKSTLVSHAAGDPLRAGNRQSTSYDGLSADGRFVTYISTAQDLVAGFSDSKISYEVYLYDRDTGLNTLVSHAAGLPARGSDVDAGPSVISGDGRFVMYGSESSDLVSGFEPAYNPYYAYSQVYVFDRRTGLNALVSHASGAVTKGGSGNSYAYAYGPGATMSVDGSVMLFISSSDNLVPGDFNSFFDIFAYVTPPPRVQSVTIADGSAQRSVIRSLTVTFDQPMFFAGEPAAAFELARNGTVVSGQWAVVSQPSPSTVTISFTGSIQQFGSLIDGKYTLRVLADQVSNIGPLDGNNDGVGGDDFTFDFHRLFGDADGNGSVDALDFRAFRAAFASPSAIFDFDNDGDVDAADFAAFRERFGGSV